MFNIPGIGRLAFDGIHNTDLPSARARCSWAAFFIIFLNLIVDIVLRLPGPAREVLTNLALLEVTDLKVHFKTDDCHDGFLCGATAFLPRRQHRRSRCQRHHQ